MTSRIIKQQQAISAVLAEDCKNRNKLLTDEKFRVMEAFSTLFEQFSYLTDALSGVKTVTVLAIRPVMKHIAEVLTMVKDTDSRFIKDVNQKISNDISKCYDHERFQQLLDKATFLDLRLKKRL